MFRTHTCGELRAEHIGKEVTLSGWVQKSRDLGGMTFIDLRDRYGITQLAFNLEKDHALCLEARKLGREFVIQAVGSVIERSSKNQHLATGHIELEVSSFRVLNASKTPPFTIEDQTDGGDELRMQYRYLDLRRTPVQQKLLLRNKVALETRMRVSSMPYPNPHKPLSNYLWFLGLIGTTKS
jgi:aspartyl-tRNA synthetase